MQIIETGRAPIHAWVDGVEFEETARRQLLNISTLPFIHDHIAVMPDVHFGIGATVGSVIPTVGAIVPASVGVDIGCGMVAQRTSIRDEHLPDDLRPVRDAIERAVPVGFAMHENVPASVETAWEQLKPSFDGIMERHPGIDNGKALNQLGTMGGGNHFCEVTVDTEGFVWVVLHSGSRGIGNKIGTFFIAKAKEEMQRQGIGLVDANLAYLTEDTQAFDEYVAALHWAQAYAATNRRVMMDRVLDALRRLDALPTFTLTGAAINCHHNFAARESHFGRENVWVTRKGAVQARQGQLGIIPGSMGARTYIVRGKGNPDSFESCSHGAGRRMGRNEAKKRLSVNDLMEQTKGIECRKDEGVLDEAPAAYKDIDLVMEAQKDLVEVVTTMRQVVCVKG